jgi:thiosulfate/3-mercaptopyruvate sulfurtransferase
MPRSTLAACAARRTYVPIEERIAMLIAAALLALALDHPMLVSTGWLAEHLQDPLVIVVEVGSRADYDSGHIPGARFIPREEIVADCDGIPNELPDDEKLVATFTRAGIGDAKRVVFYSRDPLLAARAWFTLDYLGHGSRASMLDGGWEQWTAAKHEIATKSFPLKAAPFTILTRPYSIVHYDEMRDLVRRRGRIPQRLVTIDARPPLRYVDGHIPGAVSIPWTANLTSEHPPLLRDEASLRAIYDSVAITRETIVVTYCRTGMEASMTYFVLRYLGYDVALYDGSFVEWDDKAGMVVARR